MEKKVRYSDEELEEFRGIINEKLARARKEYNEMMAALMNNDGNTDNDTSPTFKIALEGSAMEREDLIQQAQRQAEIHPGS